MAIEHTDIIRFEYRDMGYYEDDPDYYYSGGVGSAYIKLAVPKLPKHNGRYKITISIEEVEEPIKEELDHVWVQYDNLNDVCSSCGEFAYGTSPHGGIDYPSSSCKGNEQ